MPEIAEWDRAGKYDPAINQRLADLGLMGVCIPEEYGGSGMDYNALAIVCEELERGDTAFRTAVSVHTGLNRDRKSTRLNSSHVAISYAVFCLKKKNSIYVFDRS